MVKSNPREWWIDTGVTRHVYFDKEMFTTFEPVQNRDMLFMGNSTTSMIKCQGKLILKMDSRKELSSKNVLYMPDINKKPIQNGNLLFMGNSATSMIKGQGKLVLKMNSGKELSLNNVLYMSDISKNLVSESLLNKYKFRIESDEFVLSKSGLLVGKGYVSNGMFKLNVIALKAKKNNRNNSSTYLLESSNS